MSNVVVYVVTNWQNLPSKTSPLDASAFNNIETGIKNLNTFVNTLDASSGLVLSQVAFTNALKTKLDGIEAQANKYILPVATANALGGVKIDGSTIIIDQNGVISSTTSGVSDLEDLTDVNLTDLADGQILKYDAVSSKWINTSEAEVRTQLSLLEDVDIDDATLEDGQVLKYNGTSEKWENGEGGDVLGYDETIDVLGLPPNPIYRLREIIPQMTSDTTPSGECSAGSINSEPYAAWKAFDGVWSNANDRWVTVVNVYGSYLQYKFDTAKEVVKIKIQFGDMFNSTDVNCGITIKGSNDGITFTDLLQFTLQPSDRDKINEYIITNSGSYSYYRIKFDTYNIKTSGGNYNGIVCVQMYERYLA